MNGFPTAEHYADLYLIGGRTKNISEYDLQLKIEKNNNNKIKIKT